MGVKIRKSKQRNRILEVLQSSRNHVTANWIYDELRPEFPSVSLGNVYRNLNILVDQGLVNRLGFGSNVDLYEAVREPHYHFVCDRCGAVEDVRVPEDLQHRVESRISRDYGHVVTSKSVEFHGICRACRADGVTM
ncbi:MAG: transcriptional repressor [Spirochaeta sp.]|nr:transcriptional repressor [Spirochaeta sp.]